MRFKITFFLLLINLILYYAIFHYQHKKKPSIDPSNTNLLGLTIEDIQKIEIKSLLWDSPRVLVKQNSNWELLHPIQWPANFYAVQRIISQLQFLKPEVSFSVQEILDSGQSLADYGLDNPNIEVSFWNNNQKQSIKIGKATNLGNRIYALHSEKNLILVIKEDLLDSLNTRLEDLRNSNIFNIPLFDLSLLTVDLLQPHNLKIRLYKNEGTWSFEAPIQVSANNTLVNNTINQLSSLKLHNFVDQKNKNLAQTALESPHLKVTLESKHQKQTLLLAPPFNDDPDMHNLYFAKLLGNPTIFTVHSDLFLSLQNAQNSLRNKQFIKINPNAVYDIEIAQNDLGVKLQKLENNQWQLIEKSQNGGLLILPADSTVISSLIDRLQNLQAIAFISDAPSNTDLKHYGFKDPQRVIKLTADNKLTLLIGNIDKDTGNLYAKLDNSPYVYLVQPNILALTSISPLSYQDRLLSTLPKGAKINGIKLSHAQNGSTIFQHTLKTHDENWEESLSKLDPIKKQAVLGIVSNIKNFTVNEFIERQFKNNVSLDSENQLPWLYDLEIDLQLSGAQNPTSKKLHYFFTKRLSGNLQIGGSPNDDVIFSINQNWIDFLFSFHNETENLSNS